MSSKAPVRISDARNIARAALAEFLGVLLLLFISLGAIMAALSVSQSEMNAAAVVAIALAFGLTIAFLVSATANISGGHLNPAVTLAAFVAGKIGLKRAMTYIVAQVLGAVAGSYLAAAAIPDALHGTLGINALQQGVTPIQGLLIETVLTFALVMVVAGTAFSTRGPTHLAPIAIGLTVVAVHLVAIPFTGTSVNPARSLGPAVVTGDWANHWIFWLGPLMGGALAAAVFRFALWEQETEDRSSASGPRSSGWWNRGAA